MRCASCGNENPGLNRFCGMCGATLQAASSATAGSSAAGSGHPSAQSSSGQSVERGVGGDVDIGRAGREASAPSRGPAPQRPAEPDATRAYEPDSAPIISGPSFLGLNQPGPASAWSSGRDSQLHTSSRSVDYLLEDDEPKHGGGKFVLIVIALALALGFGYLRWRNGGLEWLTSGAKKALGSAPSGEASQTAANPNSDNSAATNPSPSNSAAAGGGSGANAPNAAANDTAGPTVQPGAQSQPGTGDAPAANAPANGSAGTGKAAGNGNAAAAPAGAEPGSGGAADSGASTADPKGSSAGPSSAPPSAADGRAASGQNSGAKDNSSAKAKNDQAQTTDDEEQPENSHADQPEPRGKSANPLAKPRPAIPIDTVTEAEKYIYGRGVGQDCDRGLKMLRPAANQGNAKAMISLGALYSAGLCTPRDLPTAYRWFAIALRKEPDNNSVQTDLKKLWIEMTQPERQLAIKLSQ